MTRLTGDVATFKAFAMYCDTDTMAPRYLVDEMLYCKPNRPIVDGCFVVVERTDGIRRGWLATERLVCEHTFKV